MTSDSIDKLPELPGLGRVMRHERDDHFQHGKRHKGKKKQKPPHTEIPDEAVEDLMDHRLELLDDNDELLVLPDEEDENPSLDMLI